jgi:hypothetical protein
VLSTVTIPRPYLAAAHTLVLAHSWGTPPQLSILPNLCTIVLSRTLVSVDINLPPTTAGLVNPNSANSRAAIAQAYDAALPTLLPLPTDKHILTTTQGWWKDLRIAIPWIRNTFNDKPPLKHYSFKLETIHEYEYKIHTTPQPTLNGRFTTANWGGRQAYIMGYRYVVDVDATTEKEWERAVKKGYIASRWAGDDEDVRILSG